MDNNQNQLLTPKKAGVAMPSILERPGMATLVCFWAEMMATVRKAKISIFKLHVSSIQLSTARFLGDDPAHFNCLGLPVDRFSSTLTISKVFYCSSVGPNAV
jgi:hypothetical protein